MQSVGAVLSSQRGCTEWDRAPLSCLLSIPFGKLENTYCSLKEPEEQ